MKRIKVLIAIADLRARGGAEIFVCSLVEALRQKPDVEVFLLTIYEGHHPSFEPLLSALGDHALCCERKKRIDLGSVRRFRKIVNAINPDIIHTHRSCMNTYNLAFGTGEKHWRIVHTIHSLPEKDIHHHDDRIKRKLDHRGMLTYVGISDEITKLSKGAFDAWHIVTINNGVAFTHPTPKEKEYDFIIVAGFREVKNHPLLLRAFAKVRRAHPEATLVCCGDGPTLPESKKLARDLGCEEAIHFVGVVEDVPNYLAKSRIFVLSSLYEGNPLSVLEAMDAKLPLVLPDVGGIKDVVGEGENVILYPVNDEEALTRAMLRFYEDGRLEKRGELSYRLAQDYDIERCAENYLDLYRSITDGR